MESRIILSSVAVALAAVGAAASMSARADEADGSQYALRVGSTRTRAEVQAEAARVSATRSSEPAGSRVLEVPRSSLDGRQVRAAAIAAVHAHQIPAGEASF